MHRPYFALVAALLAGCGGNDVYRAEQFRSDSPYNRSFRVAPAAACEAAERALMSQGYAIESRAGEQLKGRKEFQPEKELNAVIEINVSCRDAGSGSIMFVNAVQSQNELRRTGQSASIGIPVAGSISIPVSKSAESLVKVAGKTIDDKGFYSRFFDLVQSYLAK